MTTEYKNILAKLQYNSKQLQINQKLKRKNQGLSSGFEVVLVNRIFSVLDFEFVNWFWNLDYGFVVTVIW